MKNKFFASCWSCKIQKKTKKCVFSRLRPFFTWDFFVKLRDGKTDKKIKGRTLCGSFLKKWSWAWENTFLLNNEFFTQFYHQFLYKFFYFSVFLRYQICRIPPPSRQQILCFHQGGLFGYAKKIFFTTFFPSFFSFFK